MLKADSKGNQCMHRLDTSDRFALSSIEIYLPYWDTLESKVKKIVALCYISVW